MPTPNRCRTQYIARSALLRIVCIAAALQMFSQAVVAQTFATRAFVGQWNAQSIDNSRIALASAPQKEVLATRLSGMSFSSELLSAQVPGKVFETFIADWAGAQRCKLANRTLCLDLIALSPYVLEGARKECKTQPCSLSVKAATDILAAALSRVLEDRVLEAKLNLLLDYREEVERLAPGFDGFAEIGRLLSFRTANLKQVIQCGDDQKNCSAESVNDFSNWLLTGLARSDDWRSQAMEILAQVDRPLTEIRTFIEKPRTTTTNPDVLPQSGATAFHLHSSAQHKFRLVAVPTLVEAGIETGIFLSTVEERAINQVCGGVTCYSLGLSCLNPTLKPSESNTFVIERARDAGLDCKRDAAKLTQTLVALGLPRAIAALAVPYDLVGGEDPALEVRISGLLRIGELDLAIDEKLSFPSAEPSQIADIENRVISELNATLGMARPTLAAGAGKVTLQDLCIATTRVPCSGVLATAGDEVLLTGRLSTQVVGEPAQIRFSATLSTSSGRIALGAIRPEIGPETLQPIVEATRRWFQVSTDASSAFRSALELAAATYDQATQRVTIPVIVRVQERQIRAEIAFSILDGLSTQDFAKQVSAAFANVANGLKAEIEQRAKQLKDEVTESAGATACEQVRQLTSGLQGVATVECDPFRVAVGDDLLIDGMRLVDRGRAVDHSKLNVYRRGAARTFDGDAVHELVWRATKLDRGVLRFARPPQRTVDGIVLSPSVWIAPVGAAFDLGEVCIGIGGRCSSQWADLRKLLDTAVRKAVVAQGNKWIEARGIGALGPVSNPQLEAVEDRIVLKADVDWGSLVKFEARAVVYPKFGGFEKPAPSLGPLFQSLLSAAGADWVTINKVEPLELTLRLEVSGALAPTSTNKPPPVELTVDRNGIKGSLLIPIPIPGSYGPIWLLWANNAHIDIDLMNPARFGFGATLAFDQSSTLISMPSTITVDLSQLSMRMKSELLIFSVALFEVSGGATLAPIRMDMRARSTDVIRKVLDFDSTLDFDGDRLASSGKLDVFGFRVSDFDLSIKKDGSGKGAASYGLLGTSFRLGVETATGLFPERIRGSQGIRVAGFDAKLAFDAGMQSVLLMLDSDLVDASVELPSIKSVTPELIASLLLVRLDLDLQSLVNALRNVDDMRFAFSGSFGVGDPKHNAKGDDGSQKGRNGPAPALGAEWRDRAHPQRMCPRNDPLCYPLDTSYIYLAGVSTHPQQPDTFLVVRGDKRNDPNAYLEIHVRNRDCRKNEPANCWSRRASILSVGNFLDGMTGQAPTNCTSLTDLGCVFGRPGIPRLPEHPYLDASVRARFEVTYGFNPQISEMKVHTDEPFDLVRMRQKGTQTLQQVYVFNRGSGLRVSPSIHVLSDFSRAIDERAPIAAPARATLKTLFEHSAIRATAQLVTAHALDYTSGSTLFSTSVDRSLFLIEPDQPDRRVPWLDLSFMPADATSAAAISRALRRARSEDLHTIAAPGQGNVLVEKRGEEYRFGYFQGVRAVCGTWTTLPQLHTLLTRLRRPGTPAIAADEGTLIREVGGGSPELYSVAPYVALTNNGGGTCPRL